MVLLLLSSSSIIAPILLDNSTNTISTAYAFTSINQIDPPIPITTTIEGLKVYQYIPKIECPNEHDKDNDIGMGTIHLLRYVDKGNNTIDIYCMWNQWEGPEQDGIRQFTGFYNNKVIIGQCPFVNGQNQWEVITDAKTGLINETHWLSRSIDGSGDSMSWNMLFNYNNNGN